MSGSHAVFQQVQRGGRVLVGVTLYWVAIWEFLVKWWLWVSRSVVIDGYWRNRREMEGGMTRRRWYEGVFGRWKWWYERISECRRRWYEMDCQNIRVKKFRTRSGNRGFWIQNPYPTILTHLNSKFLSKITRLEINRLNTYSLFRAYRFWSGTLFLLRPWMTLVSELAKTLWRSSQFLADKYCNKLFY